MEITIKEGNGGYIVNVEGEQLPRIFASTRALEMLEQVGKIVFGKRVKVEEK